MGSYKKAGLIAGVVLLIIAIILKFTIGVIADKRAGHSNSTLEDNASKSQQSVQKEETQNSSNSNTKVDEGVNGATNVKNNTTNNSNNTTTNNSNSVTSSNDKKQTTLEESDLGTPIKELDEVMIISKKKIVLLDGTTIANGTQLAYCVDLTSNSTNQTLSLYTNGVVYDSLKIGDKLKIKYSLYKNDSNVEFPIIISAEGITE